MGFKGHFPFSLTDFSPIDMLMNLSPSQDGDIFVSADHPLHSGSPWTQQSQGCSRPGDFVYLPRSFVAGIADDNPQSDKRNQSSANNNATAARIGDEIR